MNYKKLFTNNVLYITGVGRSGTTILGQIIASMRPVYYLFEPCILRPPLMNDHEILRRNLFEDYFLNEIMGRVNPNPNDWTYGGNYLDVVDMEKRWNLNGRLDAIKLIEKEKPLFVIKNPEAQHQMNELSDIFPGIRFIHILRNGFDVIGSSVGRGWFGDDYDPVDDYNLSGGFEWIDENEVTETVTDKTIKFKFANGMEQTGLINPYMRNAWQYWNPTTRAACTWRVLTEMGMEYNDNNIGNFQFKYESFCEASDKWLCEICDILNLKIKKTDLTEKHLQSVKDFNPQKWDISIADIQNPERGKFMRLMEKLGYL